MNKKEKTTSVFQISYVVLRRVVCYVVVFILFSGLNYQKRSHHVLFRLLKLNHVIKINVNFALQSKIQLAVVVKSSDLTKKYGLEVNLQIF